MNLHLLQNLLQEEILPNELARLLDELFLDYLDRIIKLNLLNEETSLNVDTAQFFYMIRRLCEVLKSCD